MAKAAAAEKPAAEKNKEKGTSIRPLTDAEVAEMEKDDTPPAGYSNTTIGETQADEAAKPTEEKPAEEKAVEEKPAGEETPAAEEKPAGEKLVEEKPAEADDSFTKLERELAKPEGKEDLKDFTPREKAYFHQMRRDRKARQKAEIERDQALFREKKLQEKPPVQEADPFEGKAEDDLLTVKDIKELLKKQPANTEAKADDAQPAAQQGMRYLQMCEKEARDSHEDFDAVMELSDDLISGDSEALKELSEKTEKGENPAEVMYGMIKKHKEFDNLFPAAEVRSKAKKAAAKKTPPASSPSAHAATPTPEDKAKLDKAKQAEKALEDNANRPKTTAHVSSKEGKPAEELTLEEISVMSDMEFAKLPKQVRNRYLKDYGA